MPLDIRKKFNNLDEKPQGATVRPPERGGSSSKFFQGLGATWKEASRSRRIWLVSLGVLLVLSVGLLTAQFFGWQGITKLFSALFFAKGEEASGFPLNPEAEKKPKAEGEVSPISGLSCENAKIRPVAVMVASDPINRPLSGLSEADLIVEMPVLVNNVTRLMAVFTCGNPKEIGSVRSARHDYLFLAMGLDAVLSHWGGSYHALNRLRIEHLMDNIDALTNPANAYYRKSNLPAPYNGFTSMERLRNAIRVLKYREETKFSGYPHEDDIPKDQRPQGGVLTIGYPGSMAVRYDYDPQTNSYLRTWGGVEDRDFNNGQRIAAKNVIVMRAEQRLAKPGEPYNDVDVEGEGVAEVYKNGTKIMGKWSKSTIHKQDKLYFYDENGEEIPLVRGQIWLEIIEPSKSVTWQPGEAVAGTEPSLPTLGQEEASQAD